jgi:hypothetical protein
MHTNETLCGGTTSTAAGPTSAGKGGAPIWQPGPDRSQEIATAARADADADATALAVLGMLRGRLPS